MQDATDTLKEQVAATQAGSIPPPKLCPESHLPSEPQSAVDAKTVVDEDTRGNSDEKQNSEHSEVSHKEVSESENSLVDLTEKDLEALNTSSELSWLPYSELIPLMFGLCAGMLLSSMDSVSTFEELASYVSNSCI